MTEKKQQPNKVQKVVCPKCGELQVKIYPWSAMTVNFDAIPPCKKCMNSSLKSRVAQ